jgi:thioredoxin reductase/bacterioferritin-associated ferredoxin
VSDACDVLVIGGGPAGASAAMESARRGLRTILLDEGAEAGGQVYRPALDGRRAAATSDAGPEHDAGALLRTRLAGSGVDARFGHAVWLIQSGFETYAFNASGSLRLRSRAVIVATGTYERIVPVPGWTLPGVIGLGAATTLLKSQRVLPGRRVVVAGCGPLLLLVAVKILDAGGEVAAVVDLNGPGDVLRRLPRAAWRPDLVTRGLLWMAQLSRARVPMLWRHTVSQVLGETGVEEVRVVPVDAEWRPRAAAPGRTFPADALALGHGLVPETEITRLLGAVHEYRPDRGGWVARLDEDLRTSVPRLYVAGDGGGVAGVSAAGLQGQLAALAAARDLGVLESPAFERERRRLRGPLRRAEAFGHAMSGLMAIRSGLLEAITPGTSVCRCEDVTRGEIEEALAEGAGEMDQLKAWTRCGMGPCQGRMCGDTIASLLARSTAAGARPKPWTPRPPIRLVSIDALTGDYSYADIPLPPSAPS